MRITYASPLLFAIALACTTAPSGRAPQGGGVAQHAFDAVVPSALALTDDGGLHRIADVAERVVPAVVNVRVEGAATQAQLQGSPFGPGSPFGQGFPFGSMEPPSRRSEGSGVIVDASGRILTNHHVIAGAERVQIFLSDGRELSATVRGDDPATDLAVLQIEGEVPKDLPIVPLGNSDTLRLGEVVVAVGSPFGLRSTVTMGIISGSGRTAGLARYEDYIQTDAAINPGNSGGALVDLNGNLIGINTVIKSASGGYDGVGFAIPSNLARNIMDRLVRDGKVVRGYLGVGIDDIDATRAASFGLGSDHGALVTEVSPDSPAFKAGVQPYDIIVGVDGKRIASANDLRHTIALKDVNRQVQLDVVRDGAKRTLTARLDELDASPARGGREAGGNPEAVTPGALLGMQLAPLDESVRRALQVPGDFPTGVVVMGVEAASPAARAGLERGDVVLEVNKQAVSTPSEVAAAIRKDGQAMLLVLRNGARRVLLVQ